MYGEEVVVRAGAGEGSLREQQIRRRVLHGHRLQVGVNIHQQLLQMTAIVILKSTRISVTISAYIANTAVIELPLMSHTLPQHFYRQPLKETIFFVNELIHNFIARSTKLLNYYVAIEPYKS
jgi:hypothetical protein